MRRLISAWLLCLTGLAWSNEQVSGSFLKSQLEQVETAVDLPEERKKAIVSTYKEAMTWLDKAALFKAETRKYLHARTRAPKQTLDIRKRLEKDNQDSDRWLRGIEKQSLEDIEQQLETLKAEHSGNQAQTDELARQLTRELQRSEKAGQELAGINQEIEQLRQQLAGEKPEPEPENAADFWRDTAKLEALQRQEEMLEQEILSHPARTKLLQAQLDEAGARTGEVAKRVELLEELINQRRRQDAELVSKSEEIAEQDIVGRYPELAQVASDNARLSAELTALTQVLGRVSQQDTEIQQQAKALDEEYQSTQRKVQIAGLKEALGQVLLERRTNLVDAADFAKRMKQVQKQITETGLRQLRHQEMLRELADAPHQPEFWLPDIDPERLAELTPPLLQLLQRRQALIAKLVNAEDAYLRELSELNLALQRMLDKVQQYDAFLAEHLLWVRNTPVLSWRDLGMLTDELAVLLEPGNWKRLVAELGRSFSDPFVAIVGVLLLLLSLGLQLFVRRFLVTHSAMVARPSGGRFTTTLSVLLVSLLGPLPAWLLMQFLAWVLLHPDAGQASAYAQAFSAALSALAEPVYSLLLVRILARPRGLLMSHFGWPKHNISRLRRVIDFMLWVFVPASMLMVLMIHLGENGLAGVLVKLVFLVMAFSLGVLIYALFHPGAGNISWHLWRNGKSYLYRLRWLWFPVLLALPVVLMALDLMGYVYTAVTLLDYLINTLWLLAGMVLIQQLAEHWLLLSRRRIAYRAALRRRRQMAEQTGDGEAANRQREDDGQKVDLVALSHESRRLLNAGIVIVAAIGLWLIWSDVTPALNYLDTITLWQYRSLVNGAETDIPFTLGSLLLVLLIIFGTLIAVKNLPSLLEIILLQYFKLPAGTRYAVRTLSGYVIAALGVVLVFNTLGGDWGKIQWLVAALGVGIGFGLQEIVANFISGLIILFERPIRVGDFVTVGDTDGTVTRIQIRATTILTRDNKELLVPNKEFITGRLLNWSLSDQTTRLKLEVGIAYGEDVSLAEKLMLQAAQENQWVQPEPKPFVYFRNFGDSALILELRCHIDDVDYRVQTLSSLHHAIDNKFRAAGIQIPFPQRDVHFDMQGPLEVRLQES